ncbi:MAG: hypothetical protein IJE12_10570 [Prevotella sp.]|nr:hypothetical protein [Prevotella sp.]
MKKLMLLSLCFVALTAMGQSKYCLTYADFISDNWQECNVQEFVKESQKRIDKQKSLGIEVDKYDLQTELYLPKTGNKKTDKYLLKNAIMIMHNDSLYVNCSNFYVRNTRLGNCFAKGYRMKDCDRILFRTTLLRSEAVSRVGAARYLFGVVGHVVATNTINRNARCYILNMNSETVELVDEKLMLGLLSGSNELSEQYKQEESKTKEHADIVMDYLKKAGLW